MAQWNPNTWPSFQQSLPMLEGYQAGMNMQYQPRMNDATLAQMQAQTQGQQIKNENYPDEFKLKQYLADIAMANAKARADYNKLQRDKIPILQGNLADRTAALPAGQSVLGTNKSLMNQFLSGLAGVMGGFSGYGQDMGIPQQTTMDNSQMGTGNLQTGMSNPNSGINSQQVPITADDVANAQDATMSNLIKKNSTSAILNQRQYGDILSGLSDQMQETLPQIKQYFGLVGKGKLTWDSLKKEKPEEYQKYYDFMTAYAPAYANELKRMMGGQATDQESALMESMTNPDWNLANGEMAIKRFEALRGIESRVRQSLGKSTAQIAGQSPLGQSPSQPTAQPQTSRTSSTVSTVPLGYIEIIDPKGISRIIPASDREAALNAGGRLP
jgi:hypothetical protein